MNEWMDEGWNWWVIGGGGGGEGGWLTDRAERGHLHLH